LKEDDLDDALESFAKKRNLRKIDQKILLGIVSRAPNRHTEKDQLLNEMTDSSSSDGGNSDPDMIDIEDKRRQKFSQFESTNKSSARNLMKLNEVAVDEVMNPEETFDSRIWYGTQSPSKFKSTSKIHPSVPNASSSYYSGEKNKQVSNTSDSLG
jgi:hypothetical protein